MPAFAAFAAILSSVGVLLGILALFVRLGAIGQHIIEARRETSELKIDLAQHGEKLADLSVAMAEIKGEHNHIKSRLHAAE